MINVKPIVYNLLKSSEITELVGEDSILDAYPNEVETFPCIVYIDDTQRDVEFADNKPQATASRIVIHIFTKTLATYPTTAEIGLRVAGVFMNADYVCTSNGETPDIDPNVRHRVMYFQRDFLLEK